MRLHEEVMFRLAWPYGQESEDTEPTNQEIMNELININKKLDQLMTPTVTFKGKRVRVTLIGA